MAHTAARLRAIAAEHGPGAVSAYIGNPTAFNALATLHVGAAAAGARRAPHVLVGHPGLRQQVRRQRGRVRHVDRAPDPRPRAHRPVPRHRREPAGVAGQLLLDPQRARGAAPGDRTRRPHRVRQPAAHRDARRAASATPCSIRPDTDVWFLAALLHEIDALGGFDAGVIARHGTPRRRAAGVPRRVPGRPRRRRHRHRRRRDPRAGRGVGRHAAGVGARVDRASTWAARARSPTGSCTCCRSSPAASTSRAATSRATASTPTPSPAPASPEQGYVDTEFGRLRRGALPGTLMADAILDSAEPVRAMIVVAGNPLLSIAGEERLRKAFEQLELLVVIDIYPSATAELADVVLPCTDMYERDDLNIVNIGTSARPFAQYTPAVVAPAHERQPGVVDRPPPAAGARRAVAARRRDARPVGEVAAHAAARRRRRARRPAGDRRRRVVLPAPAPGEFFDKQVWTERRPRRLLPAVVRRRHRALPRRCSPSVAARRRRGCA